MKKIYFFLFVLMPALSSAQTITQSDLPFAGLAWINAVDTLYTNAVPAGGAAQTWDLSGLNSTNTDTTGFISPSGLPYSSFFTGSNLASFDNSANSYTYFTTNSNGMFVNGFVSDLGSVFSFNPSLLFVPVPMSFGTTRTNTGRLVVDTVISGSDIRYTSTFQSTFEADGSGTLITPVGTYNSVLRVKETTLNLDTVYSVIFGNYIPVTNFAYQNTTYRYIKPGFQPSLIATIYADSLGQFATSAEYFNGQSVSVPVVEEDKLLVFPNPADRFCNINMNEFSASMFILFDESGKSVYSGVLNSGLNSIDTQSLPCGAYFYSIDNGKKTVKGKIIVRH